MFTLYITPSVVLALSNPLPYDLFHNYDRYNYFIVNNALGKEKILMLIQCVSLLQMVMIDNKKLILSLNFRKVNNA